MIAFAPPSRVRAAIGKAPSAKAKAADPASEKKAPSAPAATGPTILTRVVGEVADRIVTSREVQINDALEQALDGEKRGGAKPGAHVLTGREPTFPQDVTRVLREWAVYLEAQTFSEKTASRADAQKRIKAALETWGERADWQRLEASEAELRDQMERKLVAREFIELKSAASQAPVMDADALAYFKKNRLKFGNLPFEDFRDNIKAFLARQQAERRLKEWFEVLDRKYRARNYVAG